VHRIISKPPRPLLPLPSCPLSKYSISNHTTVLRIEFSVTFAPGRTFCLLSFLVARALADNAFHAEYQTFEELLDRPLLERGIDYLPLPLKSDVLDRRIIPLGQEKLNAIWNRTVLVAGLRQSMKPYSLRVGAAGRLNGTYGYLVAFAYPECSCSLPRCS